MPSEINTNFAEIYAALFKNNVAFYMFKKKDIE